jgi:hypothetical protein
MKEKKRIALFTNFHPDIGGGAVNLRSIISEWGNEIELTWYYLGKNQCKWPNAICLGNNFVGGNIVKDVLITPLFLRGLYSGLVDGIVSSLLACNHDGYWVVAMNEGLAVGNCLVKKELGHKLHVSVQDDQFGWMWARSRRYKWLAPLVKKPWNQLLRGAKSVDVTSDGMQKYYHREIGLNSIVVHPYVAKLPGRDCYGTNDDEIRIGHIGSVYDLNDFQIFLKAARLWASRKKKKIRLVLIGFGGRNIKALADMTAWEIENYPSLPEAEAVKLLQACNFVYAMYPFKKAAALFRQTSLPTKLSTYIQVQRPIFAHTPPDSSLAALFNDFKLGIVVPSLDVMELTQAFDKIENLMIGDDFITARDQIYGWHNVNSLMNSLLDLG